MKTPRQGIARPIIITRPDGAEIEYESQSAAAKVEPLFQTYISAMCTGKVAMCAGFKARFKDKAYEDPETKTYRETGIKWPLTARRNISAQSLVTGPIPQLIRW